MAYALFSDVLARAGRIGGAFSVPGKHPNQADVEGFLVDVSAEVDAAITARGFDPAGLPANVKAALKDLVAYGALARALPGIDPSDRPDNVQNQLDEARKIWEDGLAGIIDGSFTAIRLLESGTAGTSAGALWTDEPDLGLTFVPEHNPILAPGYKRGQVL